MTGSVALDVVIGLVFIYLLYSLFATVIMEITNSFLGLRARNLRYTLRRMLMDEKDSTWFVSKVQDSHWVNVLKNIMNFIHKVLNKLINTFIKISGKSSNLADPGLFHGFYNQPSIKYLSAGGISNKPAYISSQNFSKALIDTLTSKFNVDDIFKKLDAEFDVKSSYTNLKNNSELEHDFVQLNEEQKTFKDWAEGKPSSDRLQLAAQVLPQNIPLSKHIQLLIDNSTNPEELNDSTSQIFNNQSLIQKIEAGISVLPEKSDTRIHLESLIRDANKDINKFKFLLELWFDNTMERSTGWYKRRVQYFLLIIGFVLSVAFNANTLEIIKKLSNDSDARAQLVELAIAYNEDNNPELNNENVTDSTQVSTITKTSKDSLISAAEMIKSDIYTAQNLISSNWQIPDSIEIGNIVSIPKDYIKHKYTIEVYDLKKCKKSIEVTSLVHKSINFKAFKKSIPSISKASFDKGKININQNYYKWYYVFSSLKFLWGYILTALAISLGSPFWFDLLNRLIKLRSSLKPDQSKSNTTNITTNDEATLINRVG